MKYEDTLMDPKMRHFWVERLSQLTLAQHLERCKGNIRGMRELCRAGVRMQHPEWNETQVEVEVTRRAHRLDLRVSFVEYREYIGELMVEVLEEPPPPSS